MAGSSLISDIHINVRSLLRIVSATAHKEISKDRWLSSDHTLSQFPIHLISVVIAAGRIITDNNIRADKDSIALQELYVFYLELRLRMSLLLIGFKPIKYSLYSLWRGAHSILLLSSSPFIPLILSLLHYS